MATKESPTRVYIDFDLAWNAATQEPIIFRIFGTNYELPADLPAMIPLIMMRAAVANNIEPEVLTEVFDSLFGIGTLHEWLITYKLSTPQLQDIISAIMSCYHLIPGDEEGNAEPPAPEAGAASSS